MRMASLLLLHSPLWMHTAQKKRRYGLFLFDACLHLLSSYYDTIVSDFVLCSARTILKKNLQEILQIFLYFRFIS